MTVGLYKHFSLPKRHNVIRMFAFFFVGSAGYLMFLSHPNTSSQLVSFPNFYSNCHEIPSWKTKLIDDWTLEEMLDYVNWTNRSACIRAHDFGGAIDPTNGPHGQKTVCLDETVSPKVTDVREQPSTQNLNDSIDQCLVYSFGINNEWSFDEAMESFGCRVFSFDPSMIMGPHNHSEKIHFYNLGLYDRYGMMYGKSPNSTKKWEMMSLDSIYRDHLKHEGRIIDYLKIDIEESEWIALPQIISSGMMDKVRQLGVEVHLFPDKDHCDLEEIRARVKIIKSLEDYGFVRFDSEFNIWSAQWRIIDNVKWQGYCAYEIAWYNSKLVRDLIPTDENSI